jgi:hypothetical protein
VKNSLRFIGLVNISLMLGLIMSLGSGYAFHAERVESTISSFQTACCHSVASTNLLSHTAEAESLVTSTVHGPVSHVKNPFNGFSFFSKGAEGFIFNIFSSHQYYLQKLIVRVQHTDLIFPFHYFW